MTKTSLVVCVGMMCMWVMLCDAHVVYSCMMPKPTQDAWTALHSHHAVCFLFAVSHHAVHTTRISRCSSGGGDFAVNLDDARFAALTSHEFALDPTDPRYKQATTVVEGLKKRRSKKTKGTVRAAEEAAGKVVPQAARGSGSSAATGELQMMVAKLKASS